MNFYENIKEKFINNEINKKVKDYSKNKCELQTYYDVGKLLIEAQGGEKRAKYENKLIKEYSIKLTKELGKGYTFTSLSRMRQFYILGKNIATLSQQLSWSHYVELLSIKNEDKIIYYVNLVEKNNLSVRELRNRIKQKEYERLLDTTKEKLKIKQELTVMDNIKNPILIKKRTHRTNTNIHELYR